MYLPEVFTFFPFWLKILWVFTKCKCEVFTVFPGSYCFYQCIYCFTFLSGYLGILRLRKYLGIYFCPKSKYFFSFILEFLHEPCTCNMYRKFGAIWTCDFWDYGSGQTDRHTYMMIAIFRIPSWGEVVAVAALVPRTCHLRWKMNYITPHLMPKIVLQQRRDSDWPETSNQLR